MRRGTRWSLILATMWLAASMAAVGYAFASGDASASGGNEVLGPGPVTITLDVEHSKFTPPRIVVREHTTVTFRVVNHDPIGHEFIVGDDEVHAIHEAGSIGRRSEQRLLRRRASTPPVTGTHGVHGTVPGEVSVAPGGTGTTKYTFHTPGVSLFACHLPGHFAYGMVGEVVVKPATTSDAS
ncbi:MAG: plastocyanin/azurin family copper-binding protein [Dehalococcoidia bacterium]